MERLFERHDEYMENVPMDFIRNFMQTVNWDSRLICIKGSKGVGKSTLLLQKIKTEFPQGSRHVLYCSADTGYFTTHSLVETADMFVKTGGTHLFIDEIHKYEGWSQELKEIYDLHKGLHVVVSGSSLLEINNGKADLSRRMIEYEMPGLSFREYLIFETGEKFDTIRLSDLLGNASGFCSEIRSKCRPLEHFGQYLKSGYYPFYFEDKASYGFRIENIVNYIIDTELTVQRNVETGNVRKVKALLQVISGMLPFEIDIAKISRNIGIQRLTTLKYLKYLEEAKLIRRLFAGLNTTSDLQKPDKILMDNPNLLSALSPDTPLKGTVRETFFCNQLSGAGHSMEYGGLKTGDFRIDGKYVIEIGGQDKGFSQIKNEENGYVAADDIDSAVFRKIPLWAFGFLY